MDLTSAFDNVWHSGLMYKLYSMNLPTTLIRWVTNFLTNRTTKIKFGDEYSEYIIMKRSVSQGAALSPILYSVYVNDTRVSDNNITIKPTNTAKYLGVTLDQKVSFKKHIMERRKKKVCMFLQL